jgi:glyoxylase-like metal-dependent hydrolase (beta-lactamase superfamily II)
MQEIAVGLWHWTAFNEHIGADVSSYYLTDGRVLIDPMTPADGLDRLEQLGPPEHVVLSNRHHDRHSWRLRERFGCAVHCIRNGLQELDGRGPVKPFDFGETLPGGIVVQEVDSICPDETALYVPALRALACADGLVEWGGDGLGFVPDSLMDDPEQTKRGLLDSYTRLLELDFDVLLLAHGEPIASGGKDALRAFIDGAQ